MLFRSKLIEESKFLYNHCHDSLKNNKKYYKVFKNIDITYSIEGIVLTYKEISGLNNIKKINYNELSLKPGGLLSMCVLQKYEGDFSKINLYY